MRPHSKSPARRDWTSLRLNPEVFPEGCNIGLILGEPSGWLVDVDLDCPEAIELADQYLPPTPAITGRPSAPKSHRWYIAAGATTEKHTDKSGSMIVELRSTGAQTVVGPSIHPSGEIYETLDAQPATVPAPMLAACVKALADAVIVRRGGSVTSNSPTVPPVRPTDATDVEARAIAYLSAMPPAVSGSGGHSQTYAAATALVHGFGIDADRAFSILASEYNPRCNPPWSEKELRHKVNQAATKPHDRPFGWLRDSEAPADQLPAVDLSHFHLNSQSVVTASPVNEPQPEATRDPGRLPESMYEVPGFVRQVMDFTLANAPYPNVALAFCGAMALQSFLAGRKVCTNGDLRTNIYLLALAGSGTGKEFPRKVNSQVLFQIGESRSIGDKFASGEGIQDALVRSGRMLFQNDEMDGVLRQINLDRDNSS